MRARFTSTQTGLSRPPPLQEPDVRKLLYSVDVLVPRSKLVELKTLIYAVICDVVERLGALLQMWKINFFSLPKRKNLI